MVGVVGLFAGICGLRGGGGLGEEGVPSQGGDLPAQVGRGLLDPPGPSREAWMRASWMAS